MRRFRFINHTADTGIIANGTDLREVFANAGYGLFSIITDLRKVRQTQPRLVEIESTDLDGLLFDWLNQLIYLFDVEHLLFKHFAVTELTEQRLTATCWGEKFDPSRHQLRIGVKSATYHMLKVDREKPQAQVIFDI